MSNNNDDLFIKSLIGVKPIKKTDKITKPLPELKQKPIKKSVKQTSSIKTHNNEKKIISSPNNPIFEKNITNRKLKQGKIPINKKVDLHGYSLEEAKNIFVTTINDCFYKNYRCILFITGKGIKKRTEENFQQNKLYYGKIRNNFLSWTSIKSIQSKILNVQQPPIKYGGDGAFFVYLRKNKN